MGERRVARDARRDVRQRQPLLLRAAARQELSSSRRRAARSSPTASSRARRSSAAIPSATRRSSTRCSPSCGASRARAAGGSRSSARRARASRATRGSACARSRSATRRCCSPATFSLEGRSIRKVRQSVSRLTKAGYAFRDRRRRRRRRRPARASSRPSRPRGAATRSERGFSMAMDDLYAAGTMFALAVSPEGEVGGFLHLAPSPAGGGWSLATMRRRPDDAERPDGVPRRRDARLGEGVRRRARCRSTSARSRTSSRRSAR